MQQYSEGSKLHKYSESDLRQYYLRMVQLHPIFGQPSSERVPILHDNNDNHGGTDQFSADRFFDTGLCAPGRVIFVHIGLLHFEGYSGEEGMRLMLILDILFMGYGSIFDGKMRLSLLG